MIELQTTDTEFDGVTVRVYRRKDANGDENAGLIYIHGGGYVFGSIGM